MRKLKNLFSTPKKAVLASLCAVIILLSVSTGTVFAAEAIAESSAIGTENAQNFAFADAGIDPVSAQIVRTEFDFEMGQFVYQVEFTADGIAYEYWIKASNGTVLKKDVELIKLDGSSVTATASITLDQAKEIALADAGLSAPQVTFTEGKLDIEEGVSVYEISFFADHISYEYEIHADTGAIYSKSKETIIVQPAPSMPEVPLATAPDHVSSYISLESAKEAALQDAAVAPADVTFTTAKLEMDDGIAEYDIEFYTATHEYAYEIHAVTGAVREKSVEARKIDATATENKSDGYIGLEKAKDIALKQAGLSASQVTFKKAKLDKDDGIVVYDIEFYCNGMEYEYEIHATTGAILDYDCERDEDA